MKYSFKLFSVLLAFFVPSILFAQDIISVKGNITDDNGDPLSGVLVLVKETQKYATSDFDGMYALNSVKEGYTLQFSSLGYLSQDVLVGKSSVINVTLKEESFNLDELVVVGYGTMKKSDLTGSVTTAAVEDFKDSPNISILQSLQGVVPGVSVGTSTGAGSEPSISIRGKNTLSGSTAPLIVLDGTIYRGSILDININDIQSVDILKDASSKSIYGSQAANGVLLLTSKDGKRESKPVFKLSSYYAFSEPAKTFTALNRDEYINKINDVYWNEAFEGPDYTTPVAGYNGYSHLTDKVIAGIEAGNNYNWVDLVTQTPLSYNVDASMAGSTEKFSYFVSAGYVNEQAYAINDNYDKTNIRINLENAVTKWLSVGAQTFMSSADYSGEAGNLRNAYIAPPVISPYNEDGSLNLYPFSNDLNPLTGLYTDNKDIRLNLMGNFYAKIDFPFIKGLSYKANYSINYRNQDYSYFNKYSNNQTGYASKSYSAYKDESFDNILNYVRTFDDVHSVNATLVYGYEGRKGSGLSASSSDFSNPTLGYNDLAAGNVDNYKVGSSAWDENSLYQMLRLNYSYNNKYMATFTVRRDGFSGFGAGKKFGIFPSGALAWVINNEDFMKDVKWVDMLKLRASYGASGNRTVGRYSTLATVSGGYSYVFGDGGSSQYGQSIGRLSNSDLGWETTIGYNIGVDFSVLNNRLSGTVDYYNNDTHDILYSVNIPSITGFSSITTNIGQVHNDGLEISLSSLNIDKKDFKWSTTVNFATNNNKIVSILGIDEDGDGVEDDLISSGLFIGQSIGTIYNYNVTGKYQIGDDIPSGYYPGNYILEDINEDGKITSADDRKVLGSTEPAYTISMMNQFQYKGFELSFFINSVQGGKDGYLGSLNPKWQEYGWHPGTINDFNTVKEFDYWTPSNTDGYSSGLQYNDPVDGSYLYMDRSFIRLQDLSFAYNFNRNWMEKIKVKDLRVFFSGKNLLTITKWTGLDPETGAGFSLGSYPVMRSYTFGFNITF